MRTTWIGRVKAYVFLLHAFLRRRGITKLFRMCVSAVSVMPDEYGWAKAAPQPACLEQSYTKNWDKWPPPRQTGDRELNG